MWHLWVSRGKVAAILMVDHSQKSVEMVKRRPYFVAFVGEQRHSCSHEMFGDAEQHHADCVYQLLYAAAGLQADFMIAVITAVLQDLGDLPTIRRNSLKKH